jgi:hypothetical protein
LWPCVAGAAPGGSSATPAPDERVYGGARLRCGASAASTAPVGAAVRAALPPLLRRARRVLPRGIWRARVGLMAGMAAKLGSAVVQEPAGEPDRLYALLAAGAVGINAAMRAVRDALEAEIAAAEADSGPEDPLVRLPVFTPPPLPRLPVRL